MERPADRDEVRRPFFDSLKFLSHGDGVTPQRDPVLFGPRLDPRRDVSNPLRHSSLRKTSKRGLQSASD
jgi:hypothetical protein